MNVATSLQMQHDPINFRNSNFISIFKNKFGDDVNPSEFFQAFI